MYATTTSYAKEGCEEGHVAQHKTAITQDRAKAQYWQLALFKDTSDMQTEP